MKELLVSISSAGDESTIDSVMEATRAVSDALIERNVNVTAVLRGKIKFQPSSIMHSDIDSMVKELEYNYCKFSGIEFPTKKLSDNGKDEEYYLYTEIEDQKVVIVINITAGVINLTKD
jgi:hypothetical protein